MKQGLNELEEALCYLKHKINQLRSAPVEESSPIDLNDDIESNMQSLHEL